MDRLAWRPWGLVAAFSLVLFLITAGTYNALGVVLPAMVKDEGWNWTEAGFGYTLLGGATGLSSFLPSALIQRAGVRVALLCGTAVMAAGFLCLSVAPGVIVYFIGAALCGVGYQMLALIPGTHVLAAVFKHRALPFGVYFTSAALGGVAGPFMVFGIMRVFHDEWRVFWLAQMLGAIVVGLLCAAITPSTAALARDSQATDAALAEETHAPGRHRVYRTPVDWTPAAAFRTPQFYVLLAAYFGHLLIGSTVASVSVAHLTQRGVATVVAGSMLSLEALMQMAGRTLGGLVGDLIDPRYLLIAALACLAVGSAALSVARDYPMMLVYAVGSGLGFGLALLSVTVLLLNYFGRAHNLEIFSATCLIGALSALGPTVAGAARDATGGFGSTFQIFAGVIAIILAAALFMRPPRPAAAPIGDQEARPAG